LNPPLPSLPALLILSGTVLVATCATLAATQVWLGTPAFFAMAAVAAACQAVALLATRHAPPTRRLLLLAFGIAVACRLPLAMGPVKYDSDMLRYIWDGRVQHLGYNPYAVVPSDPAMAGTHDADTVRMPSRNDRTPYPPAAQLFFRLVTGMTESRQVMKLALTACDVLAILLLWAWLRDTGRDQWAALWYAWNPLVILEVAHSGHIDALGAFWILVSAYCLTRKRTSLASIAFTLAVATKLLPIVLAPLYLGRVRLRDIGIGAALLAALYLPFMMGVTVPVGAVPNVVARIRFNSPIFRPLAWVVTPEGAAVFALAVGLGAAVWARLRLQASDPAAWAWPMALALACAPVIYPWYLLYFTPFLVTRATRPLLVWTWTIIPVYIVWDRATRGAAWRVPNWLMVVEYGLVVVTIVLLVIADKQGQAERHPNLVPAAGDGTPP
jgi:hypothetical protein